MRLLLTALLLVQEIEKPKTDFANFAHAREFKWAATKMVASPDGKFIWTDKSTIKIADWTPLNDAKFLRELGFHQEGKTTLALGATDSDGLVVYSLPDWKNQNAAGVGGSFVSCDLSKDRKTIVATGPFQDAICLVTNWDTAMPSREVLKGDPMIFARFTDAKKFITVSKKGGVHLWELGKPKPASEAKACDDAPGGVALSHDRRALFTAGAGALKKFSTADLAEIKATAEKFPPKPAMALSPKSRLLVLFGGGPAEFFETATLTRVACPLGREVAIGTCAFSPDETFALLGDAAAAKMYVVALADYSVVHEFDTLAAPSALAIGPRGAWILAATGTQTYAWAPRKK